jgi:hypothetical protein
MTLTTPTPRTTPVASPKQTPGQPARLLPRTAPRVRLVAAASAAVAVGAALLPAWPEGPDMGSTHYMGLLAANQPWNLLLFMAVPVILAETIAVTELVVCLSIS